MNDELQKQNNLVDTTDCLEAIDVFRSWKNILFTIIVICLLLLQTAFWAVNTKFVKICPATCTKPCPATCTKPCLVPCPAPCRATRLAVTQQSADKNTTEKEQPAAQAKPAEVKQMIESPETEKIKKAAELVAAEPNQPAITQQVPKEPQQASLRVNVTFKHVCRLINFANFVLIPTVVLYCMTLLFAMKLSIVGRLGGINHICRAFFISLVMLVLLLPWQRLFAGFFIGAMYTPCELAKAYSALDSKGIFGCIVYHLRFTGYWLLVLLLLIFAQIRSARWSKAIIRRLEVI